MQAMTLTAPPHLEQVSSATSLCPPASRQAVACANRLSCRFVDVDIAYRDVGKVREQDAEALNTRFNLCAPFLALQADENPAQSGNFVSINRLTPFVGRQQQ